MNTTGLLKKLIACRKLLVSAGVLATALFASAPAFSAQWLHCSDEGTSCRPVNPGPTQTLRYGANGVYFYTEFSNADIIACYGTNYGDPAFGYRKTCDLYPAHFSGVGQRPTTPPCATRGGTCNINDGNNQHWVYWGDPTNTTGKIVSAIKYGSFKCDLHEFYNDPAGLGSNNCWVGPRVFQDVPAKWTLCALSEGENCTPNSYEQILLAFGTTGRYTYQVATVEPGKSVKCELKSFKIDPAPGVRKNCYYSPISSRDISINSKSTGRWEVADNLSRGEGTLGVEYSYGTQETNTVAVGNAWTTTVTETIGANGILGVNATLALAQSYARSTTFTNALNTTFSKTYKTSCTATGDPGAVLWQFVLDTTAGCLAKGTCSSKTFTPAFICTQNKPDGTQPTPKCLPQHCSDTYCQVCS